MPRGGFPIQFSIQVPGAGALTTALSRYADKIDDFTPFWNEYFVPTWYSMMYIQYTSQGAATGQPWAPLSERYAAWKRKHYPGQPVGVLTGRAKGSLTSPFHPDSVVMKGRHSFAVGTDLNYPIYLQLGTRRMRARPPMRINRFFANTIGKLLQRFARDVVKGEV